MEAVASQGLIFSSVRVASLSGDWVGQDVILRVRDGAWTGQYFRAAGGFLPAAELKVSVDTVAATIAFGRLRDTLVNRFEGQFWCDSLVGVRIYTRPGGRQEVRETLIRAQARTPGSPP